MSEQLDQERVTDLSKAIMLPIRTNYLQGPISQDRALEALNALASSLAIVLLGCDGLDGQAREFFNKALEQEYKGLEQNFERAWKLKNTDS